MLNEAVVAAFLSVWLAVFFSVNLHNIMKFHRRKTGGRTYAEVERPYGLAMALAAVGTFAYFLVTLLFLFLVFSGLSSMLSGFPFGYQFPFMDYVQILGLILTSLGYFLFIWSVVVRGKYATSWEMSEQQKLVTWGPYRYVRHPSYLGYFLMFVGLFLLWPSVFTFFPMLAIPGYYQITFEEERLLVLRFGEEYVNYQNRTGRFVPKLH